MSSSFFLFLDIHIFIFLSISIILPLLHPSLVFYCFSLCCLYSLSSFAYSLAFVSVPSSCFSFFTFSYSYRRLSRRSCFSLLFFLLSSFVSFIFLCFCLCFCPVFLFHFTHLLNFLHTPIRFFSLFHISSFSIFFSLYSHVSLNSFVSIRLLSLRYSPFLILLHTSLRSASFTNIFHFPLLLILQTSFILFSPHFSVVTQ